MFSREGVIPFSGASVHVAVQEFSRQGIEFPGFAHDPYFAKGAFFTKERIICWLRTTVDESEMADWYVT